MSTRELVEVTQADRDAAANFKPEVFEDMVAGELDHWSIVQAFARHRIDSTREAAARIEGLEAALRDAISFVEHISDQTGYPADAEAAVEYSDKLTGYHQALSNTGGGGD